jgi:hypothetical protein
MEPMSLQFVKKKLITKEDPQHVHKVLGILALVSFAYRYFYYYPKYGTLGMGADSWLTWASIFIHLGLSTSSIIFHVLPRRILNTPIIIWEEYRLHAIVFTLKTMCVALWALLMRPWFGERFGHNTDLVAFFFLQSAHNMVVDEITRRYGEAGQTTVRVKDDYGFARKMVLRFYSYYQLTAFAAALTPTASPLDMADLGFNSLIAIQSSAFLMTLCRKGFITSTAHGSWYGACLLLSIFHIFRIHNNWTFFLATLAVYAARVGFGLGKYTIWSLYVFIPIGFAHITENNPSMLADAFDAARVNIQPLLF